MLVLRFCGTFVKKFGGYNTINSVIFDSQCRPTGGSGEFPPLHRINTINNSLCYSSKLEIYNANGESFDGSMGDELLKPQNLRFFRTDSLLQHSSGERSEDTNQPNILLGQLGTSLKLTFNPLHFGHLPICPI